MELAELKAELDVEKERLRAELQTRRTDYLIESNALRDDLDYWTDKVDERMCELEYEMREYEDSVQEEMDYIDRDRYGDWYDRKVDEIKQPLWDAEFNLREAEDALFSTELKLSKLDADFDKKYEKLKAEHKETAVLRWLG